MKTQEFDKFVFTISFILSVVTLMNSIYIIAFEIPNNIILTILTSAFGFVVFFVSGPLMFLQSSGGTET